jgi:hypothetical protein
VTLLSFVSDFCDEDEVANETRVCHRFVTCCSVASSGSGSENRPRVCGWVGGGREAHQWHLWVLFSVGTCLFMLHLFMCRGTVTSAAHDVCKLIVLCRYVVKGGR